MNENSMKFCIRVVLNILWVGVLVACNTSPKPITSSTTPTHINLLAPTLMVFETATLSTTTTPASSRPSSPTPTPRPTQTPLPTVTLPTILDPEKAEEEIKQLLQDYNACSPPCYLGIIPGYTTLSKLKDLMYRWGIQLHENTSSAKTYSIAHDFADGLSVYASFYLKDEMVETIELNAIQDQASEWSAYKPEALLRRYGSPTNVSFWIGSIHEPSPTPWKGWYYMNISYDELNLYVSYGGVEIRLDEPPVICPNKDYYRYARIRLGKYPDFGVPFHATPIEEAASLTPNEFHRYLLIGPGACFYLDLSKVLHL